MTSAPGVDRAISIVERALELYGAPIYVRREVVHNRSVVDSLRERGAVFIEEIAEVPDGSILIFSAHGVSRGGTRRSQGARSDHVVRRHLPIGDQGAYGSGARQPPRHQAILIGHAGHPEVEGTMGQYGKPERAACTWSNRRKTMWKLRVKDESNLCFMTQTTLSVDDTSDVIDALRQRFPSIIGPRKDDICYATTNRQEAVRNLAMAMRMWCWWWGQRTLPTLTVWLNWRSAWANRLI